MFCLHLYPCLPAVCLSLLDSVSRKPAFWNISWGFMSPLDLSQLPPPLPFPCLPRSLQRGHIFCEAFASPARTRSCHTFVCPGCGLQGRFSPGTCTVNLNIARISVNAGLPYRGAITGVLHTCISPIDVIPAHV